MGDTGKETTCEKQTNMNLTEKVSTEYVFTPNMSFGKQEDSEIPSGTDRRKFWTTQWEQMNSKKYQTCRPLDDPRGGHRERWEELKKSGKSPIEIWESYVDEMDKNGAESKRKFNKFVFENEEVRQKWEEARAAGNSEEFWYEYWDNLQKRHPFISKPFGHPREIQTKWTEMKAEGKEPEEIWQTIMESRRSRLSDMFGNHHGDHHRHHGHRWNRCGERARGMERFCNRKRVHDESYIYEQFDF